MSVQKFIEVKGRMEASRLLGLPDELLLDIVNWMAPEDQANMKLICQKMWTLCDWPITLEFLKIPAELNTSVSQKKAI